MRKKGSLLAVLVLCMGLGGCRHIMPFSEDVATAGTVPEGSSASADAGIPFKSRPRDEEDPSSVSKEKEEAGKDTTGTASENEAETVSDADTAVETGTLAQARRLAAMYDYDGAIALLQAEPENEEYAAEAARITEERDSCVAWAPEQVTHVFYHTLVKDTALAFDGDEDTAG